MTQGKQNRKAYKDRPIADINDPDGFGVLGEKYFQALAVAKASPTTISGKRELLRYFADWCAVRGVQRPADVTVVVAEGYQKYLHHYRKADDKPLTVGSQRGRLTAVRMFYRWLVKVAYLPHSPLETLTLPSLPRSLPRAMLSEAETEKVLAQADLETAIGLRDRAIMEVLYSTGIRRAEVLNLRLNDVDRFRGLIRVNEGKGQKDRVIPIGERAVLWIERYLADGRPELVKHVYEDHLFISQRRGARLSGSAITERLHAYIQAAGIDKPGSVHIFRHTTATLMLENGADIRHIQAMLGHEDLSTTQVYTQVAVTHLKDVHSKTHPAKLPGQDNPPDPDKKLH